MKTYNFSGVKVLVKVGDLHYGRFANSLQFLDDTQQFMRELLIPAIDKLLSSGYTRDQIWVVFFGDKFDNKQHIDQIINSGVIDVEKEISQRVGKIIEVVGNHDTKLKHDLSHSSQKSLGLIPNIDVIIEPTIYNLDGKCFGVLPWYNDAVSLKAALGAIRAGGAVRGWGHNSVAGFSYEGIDVPAEGHLSVEDFAGFEKFEMGHIHKEQESGNVHFLGTPYHCRTVESGNEKVGFYIEFLDKGKQTFVENKISPRFKTINLFELLNMKETEAQAYVKNSFVTVQYPYILSNTIDFTKISTVLSGYRKLDFQDYVELFAVTNRATTQNLDENITFNLNELFERYLSQLGGFKVLKQTVVLSDTQKDNLRTMLQERITNSNASKEVVM